MTSTSTAIPDTSNRSDPADQARDEVANAAQSGKEAAREVAESQYSRGRDEAASQIDSASSALDDVASTLEKHDSPFASYATELSDQLSSFSNKVSTSSMDEMVSGARSLARSNPAAFMLGSVAIGLAASRFFKATSEQVALDNDGKPVSDTQGGRTERKQLNDRHRATSSSLRTDSGLSYDPKSRSADSGVITGTSPGVETSAADLSGSDTLTDKPMSESVVSESRKDSAPAHSKRESHDEGVV